MLRYKIPTMCVVGMRPLQLTIDDSMQAQGQQVMSCDAVLSCSNNGYFLEEQK